MTKRVKELSLERAKALLGNNQIPDEQLIRVLEQIKAFCKIAYQLYSPKGKSGKDLQEELKTAPPDEFTNAA